MAKVKRPILAREDRVHLNTLSGKALQHVEERSTDPAYAQGVLDVLTWLTGADMTPLLQEVTR